MSSETWQNLFELLALSPWIAFVVAVVWCWLLGLRDDARDAAAAERAHSRTVERRVEQTPNAES